MTPPPVQSGIGRQLLLNSSRNQEAEPRGIKRKRSPTPVRKSARLQEKKSLYLQAETRELRRQFPSPTSLTPNGECPQKLADLSAPDRKRKRSEELGEYHQPEANEATQETPVRKRQQTSPINRVVAGATPVSLPSCTKKDLDPVQRWIEEGIWYGGNLSEDSDMAHCLTQKRSITSLSKHESEISGVSFREGKNPAVRNRLYQQILELAGIYMSQPEQHLRVVETDKTLCKNLLNNEQPLPKDSLFNDDLFESTCEDIANRNEARVIQDIGRLIVPAPEELFRRGAKHLKHLIETVNEGWIKSIPLVKGPRPQPDFAVGLKYTAFTPEQRKKLEPSIGDWQTTSRLVATAEMYFPFLTVEVKCGNEALNIADRQNAHSATFAANAVVELYKLVSRQDELNRKILSFSISHDNDAVRIYGHYALIKGKQTLFYREPVDTFVFTRKNGQEKWTPYKFTRNVYDVFYPIHYERICSAIDQLPDFDVDSSSRQSDLHSVDQSNSQLTASYSQQSEPDLPSTQTSEPVFKKPKARRLQS